MAMAGEPRASRRSNLIVFMTDDHGAWASSPYGCKEFHTPNLQALSDGGARFTRAYAATPVCSPSRMTYITGTLPSRHTVQDWLVPADSFGPKSRRWLDGLTTYSSLLAKAGYRCGMTGKWHMGHDDEAQEGFTYWATVPGGGGTFKDVSFIQNGQKVPKSGFKEDAIGDFALDFLEQGQRQDPFFLLVPFYAPHTPYDFQPEEDRAPYAHSRFPCYPRGERHPWANRGLRVHHLNEASMRAYGSLITGMDRNIGRILRYLEMTGQRESTTIVFTADQGWNAGHHGFWGKGNGTWPFNMFEESIQVPMIWNHPGRIRAGQTLTPMVSSYDFAPTVLDWMGVPAMAAAPERPGRSYAGFLRGKRPKWENELYFEYSMVRAVRTQNLKLVERTKEWPSELYDLEKDPGETRNLIDDPEYSKQRAALSSRIQAFFTRTGAPPHEQWRDPVKQNLTVYSR
jgi:arylsulfatase A-like enzyme